jgi:hypothetical protein
MLRYKNCVQDYLINSALRVSTMEISLAGKEIAGIANI